MAVRASQKDEGNTSKFRSKTRENYHDIVCEVFGPVGVQLNL